MLSYPFCVIAETEVRDWIQILAYIPKSILKCLPFTFISSASSDTVAAVGRQMAALCRSRKTCLPTAELRGLLKMCGSLRLRDIADRGGWGG